MKCPYSQNEINIKELKIRSTPQNKYYWGVIINIISNELGYTPTETHEVLRHLFLNEIVHPKTKENIHEVIIVKSTSELNVGEFEDYLSATREFASLELGIYIPIPNETEMNG